jgi:hypothetical protein
MKYIVLSVSLTFYKFNLIFLQLRIEIISLIVKIKVCKVLPLVKSRTFKQFIMYSSLHRLFLFIYFLFHKFIHTSIHPRPRPYLLV